MQKGGYTRRRQHGELVGPGTWRFEERWAPLFVWAHPVSWVPWPVYPSSHITHLQSHGQLSGLISGPRRPRWSCKVGCRTNKVLHDSGLFRLLLSISRESGRRYTISAYEDTVVWKDRGNRSLTRVESHNTKVLPACGLELHMMGIFKMLAVDDYKPPVALWRCTT